MGNRSDGRSSFDPSAFPLRKLHARNNFATECVCMQLRSGRLFQRTIMNRQANTAVGLRASVALLPVIAASLLGQWATYPNIASWYAALVKPSFNPPNWIFAPVWITLYVLMAYAVWRILKVDDRPAERRVALTLFFLQLTLNALWSWLFFGLNNPLDGLLNILPQFLLILATIDRFRRLDLIAALCLVPLASWVAFASLLNFEIWRLNG